jgi:hypothetical protein
MSHATGVWTVVIDGQPHEVAAQWDRYGSGGGRITIDGVVVRQWRLGMKWPGAQQRFRVGGREFVVVKRGISDLQIDLYAAEPGLGWPVAPPASKDWLVFVVVLVVLLVFAAIITIAAMVIPR